MKSSLKYILQKILGFNTYLFVFSKFIIKRLGKDKKEKDFMYFLNMIHDKGIVLDIGANIGIMTVHLAKKLKESDIIAFEPIPQNLVTLKRIIKHYKLSNVKVLEIALGNENKELEMIMPVVKSVKMQGLSHVVHNSINEFNEGIKIMVKAKRLDDLKELNNNKPISAIKIDVENFEYYVFKGGEKLILKHKPIIYCELWDNENRQKCFNLMKSYGYKTQCLEGKGLIDINKTKDIKQNFFFIPIS